MPSWIAVAVLCGFAATARAERDPPKLESAAVVALDVTTGAELFARRADDVRPIASMTKIFAGLALRKREVDLAKSTTIVYADAKAGIGGANTLLIEGQTFSNADLMAAMFLVSDNRTPTALARSAGMSPDELLVAMTRVAKDLGLSRTKFDDVTGIAGNASTAREMALALHAAMGDPVLARYLRTRYADVTSASGEIKAAYRSTVAPLFWRGTAALGGKTGHTDAAGYCMVIEAKLGERRVAMTLLGAPSRAAVANDYAKLVDYLGE